MHVPSSMSNVVATNSAAIFYPCVTANFPVTGTALTADTFESADRAQTTQIGADVNAIVFQTTFRSVSANMVVEMAYFKVERAHVVPTNDDVLLPSDATIAVEGLQAAFRKFQPGRLLRYEKIPVSADNSRSISRLISYKKFRMAKVRTGDYYGLMVYVRGSASVVVDFEARYNAKS